MSDHVYKHIEVTGSSTRSSDHAVQTAITKASKSVREMRWFEVTALRGDIKGDEICHWQATLKIGFRLDE